MRLSVFLLISAISIVMLDQLIGPNPAYVLTIFITFYLSIVHRLSIYTLLNRFEERLKNRLKGRQL